MEPIGGSNWHPDSILGLLTRRHRERVPADIGARAHRSHAGMGLAVDYLQFLPAASD
jgi:hypothetical protein